MAGKQSEGSTKGPGRSIARGTKSPNPIDVHVGNRVKRRRVALSMSQEKLGAALGLSFQQVQKYERGVNRLGASRLWEVAQILQTSVQYFYEDLKHPNLNQPATSSAGGFADVSDNKYNDFLNTREGQELIKHFMAISDPKQRRNIVEIVRGMAESSRLLEK